MSGRRANTNRIRGPQSALTDFLAANNISAAQIREQHEQRQAQAETALPADSLQLPQTTDPASSAVNASQEEAAETAAPRKRKRGKESQNVKASKKNKKSKKDDGSDDDYNDLGADMYKKSKPRPGQLDNCEICEKRFTVTAYSKEGPNGGFVCNPCGKQLKPESSKNAKATKKGGAGASRRKTESNRLDGYVSGPKALSQLCIEKVAQHHEDIEEFGDVPEPILLRLGEIFSKKRVLTPKTLPLFMRPDLSDVVINDAAYLNKEEFQRIFSETRELRKIVLRNAGQLKDEVVDHMIDRCAHLQHLQIYGANLVSNEKWISLFEAIGQNLETIKLEWMDAAFNDEVVGALVRNCPNLKRLKLKMCRQLTPACLEAISRLGHLEHLSLQLASSPEAAQIVFLLETVGARLRTLSLEGFYEINDDVVALIRDTCCSLRKLRLTDIDGVTDAALYLLFNTQPAQLKDGSPVPVTKLPSLRFVDFSAARDVDNNNSAGPADHPVGLGKLSFPAMMKHSGQTLQVLCIPSCRHIDFGAFSDVFAPAQKAGAYRELREVNVSFVPAFDTDVTQALFACCPSLQRVIAFGCFGIKNVVVPRGVVLIGVPRAQDTIEKVGDWDADIKGKKVSSNNLDDLSRMGSVTGMVGAVGA